MVHTSRAPSLVPFAIEPSRRGPSRLARETARATYMSSLSPVVQAVRDAGEKLTGSSNLTREEFLLSLIHI